MESQTIAPGPALDSVYPQLCRDSRAVAAFRRFTADLPASRICLRLLFDKDNMANREELAIIRGARSRPRRGPAGELGKLYLFGSAGLPRSLPTALHWLDRAARQGCPKPGELIGNHIPLDWRAHSRDP
jgi:hypothetical protein